jgi:hypothetical protein
MCPTHHRHLNQKTNENPQVETRAEEMWESTSGMSRCRFWMKLVLVLALPRPAFPSNEIKSSSKHNQLKTFPNLTNLQLLSTLIDWLTFLVVQEAIFAHEHDVGVKFVNAGVLTSIVLLLHRCKVYGILDDLVVVGNVETFGVDRFQKRPCKVLTTTASPQFLQDLLAVSQLLAEFSVITWRQLIVVNVEWTFYGCTTFLFNDWRWRRFGFAFEGLLNKLVNSEI